MNKEEIETMIHNIKIPMFSVIVKLQISTGVTACEAISIMKSRVKVSDDNVRIMVKNRKRQSRQVFINKALWNEVQPFYSKGYRYVFLDERYLTYLSYWDQVYAVYAKYNRAIKKAAGSNIKSNDLRRFFMESVMNEYVKMQRVMGHTDMRTTMRYKDGEEVKAAMLRHQEAI